MSSAPSRSIIEQLQQEMIAQHRQALLGAVAGMAAHEFNNLMTPVLFRAQDALERDEVSALRKAVECTARQAERAVTVARRLIEVAQGDEVQSAGACDVRGAIDNALTAMVRPLAKDGIDLRIDVDDALAVRAERILFEQVLLNLLINARDAARGRVRVSATREEDFVRIEVACSALVPDLDTIRRFLAADPTAEPCDWQGVGLGLSVCRLIAWRHSAEIDVSANEDSGCTFILRWPAA